MNWQKRIYKINTVDYQEAIDILTSQGKFYINLGLERMQKILSLLGNPEKKLDCIHVSGTNGKGSVCAMLSAVMRQGRGKREEGREEVGRAGMPDNIKVGLKVGLFTSPHVFEYTERIKINDVEIEKNVFAKGVNDIIKLAENNDVHLTEFEIITALAFDYFTKNNVDIVILETGLGGRLDATNVIEKNLCSVITHIDFDHTERLGDTIEKIAYEKAGIIKENCPVVISPQNAGFEVIKNFGGKCNSDLIIAEEVRIFPQAEKSALKGTYQKENLALVLKVLEVLNLDISQEEIEQGLKNVKHPCRFEYLKEYNILIDGAHNPNGTKVLRESLNCYFPKQKFKFIFGCLRNKEYALMMENLFTPQDEIYFYTFDNQNSCKYQELAAVCRFESKPFSEFQRDDNTLMVICGSFYMIKELLFKMGIK